MMGEDGKQSSDNLSQNIQKSNNTEVGSYSYLKPDPYSSKTMKVNFQKRKQKRLLQTVNITKKLKVTDEIVFEPKDATEQNFNAIQRGTSRETSIKNLNKTTHPIPHTSEICIAPYINIDNSTVIVPKDTLQNVEKISNSSSISNQNKEQITDVMLKGSSVFSNGSENECFSLEDDTLNNKFLNKNTESDGIICLSDSSSDTEHHLKEHSMDLQNKPQEKSFVPNKILTKTKIKNKLKQVLLPNKMMIKNSEDSVKISTNASNLETTAFVIDASLSSKNHEKISVREDKILQNKCHFKLRDDIISYNCELDSRKTAEANQSTLSAKSSDISSDPEKTLENARKTNEIKVQNLIKINLLNKQTRQNDFLFFNKIQKYKPTDLKNHLDRDHLDVPSTAMSLLSTKLKNATSEIIEIDLTNDEEKEMDNFTVNQIYKNDFKKCLDLNQLQNTSTVSNTPISTKTKMLPVDIIDLNLNKTVQEDKAGFASDDQSFAKNSTELQSPLDFKQDKSFLTNLSISKFHENTIEVNLEKDKTSKKDCFLLSTQTLSNNYKNVPNSKNELNSKNLKFAPLLKKSLTPFTLDEYDENGVINMNFVKDEIERKKNNFALSNQSREGNFNNSISVKRCLNYNVGVESNTLTNTKKQTSVVIDLTTDEIKQEQNDDGFPLLNQTWASNFEDSTNVDSELNILNSNASSFSANVVSFNIKKYPVKTNEEKQKSVNFILSNHNLTYNFKNSTNCDNFLTSNCSEPVSNVTDLLSSSDSENCSNKPLKITNLEKNEIEQNQKEDFMLLNLIIPNDIEKSFNSEKIFFSNSSECELMTKTLPVHNSTANYPSKCLTKIDLEKNEMEQDKNLALLNNNFINNPENLSNSDLKRYESTSIIKHLSESDNAKICLKQITQKDSTMSCPDTNNFENLSNYERKICKNYSSIFDNYYLPNTIKQSSPEFLKEIDEENENMEHGNNNNFMSSLEVFSENVKSSPNLEPNYSEHTSPSSFSTFSNTGTFYSSSLFTRINAEKNEAKRKQIYNSTASNGIFSNNVKHFVNSDNLNHSTSKSCITKSSTPFNVVQNMSFLPPWSSSSFHSSPSASSSSFNTSLPFNSFSHSNTSTPFNILSHSSSSTPLNNFPQSSSSTPFNSLLSPNITPTPPYMEINEKISQTEALMIILSWTFDLLSSDAEISSKFDLSVSKHGVKPSILKESNFLLRNINVKFSNTFQYFHCYFPLLLCDLFFRLREMWKTIKKENGCKWSEVEIVKVNEVDRMTELEATTLCTKKSAKVLEGFLGVISCIPSDGRTRLLIAYISERKLRAKHNSNGKEQKYFRFYLKIKNNLIFFTKGQKVDLLCFFPLSITMKEIEAITLLENFPLKDIILDPSSINSAQITLNKSDAEGLNWISYSRFVVRNIKAKLEFQDFTVPKILIINSFKPKDTLSILINFISDIANSKNQINKHKILICVRSIKLLETVGIELLSLMNNNVLNNVAILDQDRICNDELKKLAFSVQVDNYLKKMPYQPVCDIDENAEAQKFVLKNCDVVLSRILNSYSPLINSIIGNQFSACIVLEAYNCTEPETLLPLLYGIRKLALIGNSLGKPRILSPHIERFHYYRSLAKRIEENVNI